MSNKKIYNYISVSLTVKGFTIMELLVSMLVFISIVSVALLLLMNVQKGIGLIKKDSNYFSGYQKFSSMFEKDYLDALAVLENGNEITCRLSSGDVVYSFMDEKIIRSGGNTEFEFTIKLFKKQCFFYLDSDFVEAIDFTFSYHGEELPFYIYKEYDSKEQIKYLIENAGSDTN